MKWLVTGGAGYIGSHVVRALLLSGRETVVLDDLSTGLPDRVPADVPLEIGSIGNVEFVSSVLDRHRVAGVVHIAAKKAVEESLAEPLRYYRENVDGLLSLLEAMTATDVRRIVYSSSAAVYGFAAGNPVTESMPTVPISPYGETKLIGEWIVSDVARAHELSWVTLRYFNVAGAGSPALGDTSVANLIPILIKSAVTGGRARVFGSDYPTPDGTCVRDYIHVSDLADAHVAAARLTEEATVAETINIGTGRGSSVLDVVSAVRAASGSPLPAHPAGRRPGDPPALVAEADRAAAVLGWHATHDLHEMVRSAWEARP